jgi:hypothetical protein
MIMCNGLSCISFVLRYVAILSNHVYTTRSVIYNDQADCITVDTGFGIGGWCLLAPNPATVTACYAAGQYSTVAGGCLDSTTCTNVPGFFSVWVLSTAPPSCLPGISRAAPLCNAALAVAWPVYGLCFDRVSCAGYYCPTPYGAFPVRRGVAFSVASSFTSFLSSLCEVRIPVPLPPGLLLPRREHYLFRVSCVLCNRFLRGFICKP